jgi:hypothetical protein
MFNLDQAIGEWRRQMLAAGIKTPEVLDELESHLRDDVEQQVQSGLSEEKAFEAAVRKIGQVGALKREFEKIGEPRQDWKPRFMAKCLIGVLLASGIVGTSASAFFKIEMTWGEQLLWFAPVALTFLVIWGWRYVASIRPAIPGDPERFSAFTASAKEELEFARAQSASFHHGFIGTEHVLLGLLKSENGIVPNLLRRNGVDREAIRKEIEKLIGPAPVHDVAADIPYTPRAKKALLLAVAEAKALKHTFVSGEHIFLGLLLEGSGLAPLVLKNLGVQIGHIREEILKELNRDQSNG